MRIVHISDTHGMHNQLDERLPAGDVLVHTGDVSGHSTKGDIEEFEKWFSQQDYAHKIWIAGNHDKFAPKASYYTYGKNFSVDGTGNVYYLFNNYNVYLEDVCFSAMSYTPTFMNWYNMADPGSDKMLEAIDNIHPDTEVLLTHGPMRGVLDACPKWPLDGTDENVGCKDLRDAMVLKKIQPKVHLFGHIHESYGWQIGTANAAIDEISTEFYNGSICTGDYEPTNEPHVIDI